MTFSDRLLNRYQKSGFYGLITSSADVIVRKAIPNTVLKRMCRPCVENIITREQLRNHKDLDHYIEFSTPEKIQVTEPTSIEEIPAELMAHLGEYSFEQPFVCSLSQATLFGSKAIGVDNDHNILLETSLSRADLVERTFIQKPMDVLFYHTSKKVNRRSYRVVVPLVEYYGSYHHWVFNSLTRLEGIEAYTSATGIECKILLPSDPPSWMTESLLLLGYDEDQLIGWDSRHATASTLVIPSIRRIENTSFHAGSAFDVVRKVVSPQACRWVRETAINNLPEDHNSDYSEKIIISREDVGTRTIQNKEEVYSYLHCQGFEEYQLAEMNFTEQVRLFSKAELVVSPHGAGLTNIIFADNCSVIEIFGENIKKPTYHILSSILNHKYGFLVGDQPSNKGKDSSIDVDIEELNIVLEMVMNSD